MFPTLGSTVCRIYGRLAYVRGHYEHARSQSGRQPAAAKPPLYLFVYFLSTDYTAAWHGRHGACTRVHEIQKLCFGAGILQ